MLKSVKRVAMMLLISIVILVAAISAAEDASVDYYIIMEPNNATIEGTNKGYGDVTIKLYYTTNPNTPAKTASGSQIPNTFTFSSSNSNVAYVQDGRLYSGSSCGSAEITVRCDPYGNGTMVRTATSSITVVGSSIPTDNTNQSGSQQQPGDSQTQPNADYYIVMEPDNATIEGTNKGYGDVTVKLYYTANPNTPSQVKSGSEIPSTISFSSSNSNVAYVQDGRLYSGSSCGSAEITVRCDPYGNGTMVRTATSSIIVVESSIPTDNTDQSGSQQQQGDSQTQPNADYYIVMEPDNATIEGTNKGYGDVIVKLYYTANPNTPSQVKSGSEIPSTISFSSSNPNVAYVQDGRLYSGASTGSVEITARCNPYGNGTMVRTATINVVVKGGITDPQTNILQNEDQNENDTQKPSQTDEDYFITVEPSSVSISELNELYQDITVKLYYTKDKNTPAKVLSGSQIPSTIKFNSSNLNVAYVVNGKIYSGSSEGTSIITVICDPFSNGTMIRTANIEVRVSKSAPQKPTFTVSKDTPDKGMYTIKISYSTDSIVKKYKIEEKGDYKEYTQPIVVKEKDITIFAKGQNSAGIWSTENSIIVGAQQSQSNRPPININIKYNDLSQNHWAYNSVMKMTQLGILEGFGDGTFKPEEKVTREQFAKVLVLSMDTPLINQLQPTFADLPSTWWSYPYVETVKEYMNGYRVGNNLYFRGQDVALREDMVVAIVLARGLQNETPDLSVLNSYYDKDLISPGLKDLIAIAVKNNIIEGYGNGYLGPRNTLTRAEACELMYKSKILK